MRKLLGPWLLFVACAASAANAQDGDVRSAFGEMEQLAAGLKSVADKRNECLRLYQPRAADILAAYGKSSAAAYPELLKLSDPIPVAAQPLPQDRGSSDDGWRSCLADLAAALDRFDTHYANRQDEMKFIYENRGKVLASLRARNSSPPVEVGSRDNALSAEGAKVRVLSVDTFSVFASCALVGNLFTVSSSVEVATNVLRNETARRGGDTLILTYTSADKPSTPLRGTIFRCD